MKHYIITIVLKSLKERCLKVCNIMLCVWKFNVFLPKDE